MRHYIYDERNIFNSSIDVEDDSQIPTNSTTIEPVDRLDMHDLVFDSEKQEWYNRPFPSAWDGCSITEDEANIHNRIIECKEYLASTDYKMTVDYFATLSPVEQDELVAKRAEARDFIREHK